MTIEQAKELRVGQTVYATFAANADGTCMRYKVTGAVQTWKRNSGRVRVPLKRGLYDHAAITENNLSCYDVSEESAQTALDELTAMC